MHLFQWPILLYLSFHAIGFIFTMASALGIPGHLDKSNLLVKVLSILINLLMAMAWIGIPFLLIGALFAFSFDYLVIGKILSIISLVLGISLFLCMIILYIVK